MKTILIGLSLITMFSCGNKKKDKFRTNSNTITVQKTPEKENPHTEGEKLFKINCAACHKVNKKFVGPALNKTRDNRKEEWLISFIQNSQKLIKSGDSIAVKLYEDNGKTVMPNFNHLSKEDINHILDYVNFK